MTPEERARQATHCDFCGPAGHGVAEMPCAIAEVAQAIRAAVAEEREACAIIAWEYARGLRHAESGVGSEQVGDHIAAAIRARP